MKIVMTGSTGFVGGHVRRRLEKEGHEVVRIGRQQLSGDMDSLAYSMVGANALINLAGAPINRRWTAAYKREIYSSRIETTRRLVDAMATMNTPPSLFVSTSAIGAFSPDGRYTESDPANASDFLGRLSQDWEREALRAESLGVRTLIFRLALVLGHDGGLMKQLLPVFRLGLGGPVGDGRQHFSWVHIDDLVSAYLHALENQKLSGVYHTCAPNPSNNLDFTKVLGSALGRPTLFRVPEIVLKLAFGEGAEAMTSGQCVVSERLPKSGFRFRFPELSTAVEEIVSHSRGGCPITGRVTTEP